MQNLLGEEEKMEKLSEFEYLGTGLCKNGSMEGEISEGQIGALKKEKV